MVVLAWVPGVDIKKFEPFGFEISADSALSIWALLSCVLIYYFANFMFTSLIERRSWNLEHVVEFKKFRGRHNPEVHRNDQLDPKTSWDIQSFEWRLWADMGPPIILFIAALVAAISSMVKLWPT
jgi:hypothetical protein